MIQPIMATADVDTRQEVDEDGNYVRTRAAKVKLTGEFGEDFRALVGMDKSKKRSNWIAWVMAGVLAAIAILFLILFLVKDGKDDAKAVNPPQPAPVQQTQPAPAPATISAVDNTARSSAAEAGLKAEAAQNTADTAMVEAERVGQDLAATDMAVGNLVDNHPAMSPDACASELERRWLMPGAPLQRMLKKEWLTEQQVQLKAKEECAR